MISHHVAVHPALVKERGRELLTLAEMRSRTPIPAPLAAMAFDWYADEMLTLSPGVYNDGHWGLLHEFGHNHQVRRRATLKESAEKARVKAGGLFAHKLGERVGTSPSSTSGADIHSRHTSLAIPQSRSRP